MPVLADTMQAICELLSRLKSDRQRPPPRSEPLLRDKTPNLRLHLQVPDLLRQLSGFHAYSSCNVPCKLTSSQMAILNLQKVMPTPITATFPCRADEQLMSTPSENAFQLSEEAATGRPLLFDEEEDGPSVASAGEFCLHITIPILCRSSGQHINLRPFNSLIVSAQSNGHGFYCPLSTFTVHISSFGIHVCVYIYTYTTVKYLIREPPISRLPR
jgi:hypothetical protein